MKQDRTEDAPQSASVVGREFAALNRAIDAVTPDDAQTIIARMVLAEAATAKDALALVSSAHSLFSSLMRSRRAAAGEEGDIDFYALPPEELVMHAIDRILERAVATLEKTTKTPPGTYTGHGPMMN